MEVVTRSLSSLGTTFRQSHKFLYSSQSFSSVEELLIALMCSKVLVKNDIEEDFSPGSPRFVFSHDMLCTAFKTERKNLYGLLSDPCVSLMNLKRHCLDPKRGEFELTNMFVTAKLTDEGLILEPSHLFYRELFELGEGGYAEIEHRGFWQLKNNKNAMRLYRMLSRFKGNSRLYAMDIERLKLYFGVYEEDPVSGEYIVKKESYQKTSVFMARVIKPAIKEIADSKVASSILVFHQNEDTMGYKLIREGRKITKVEFLYHWQELQTKQTEQKDYGYSKKDAYDRITELLKAKRSRSLELEELYELKACFEIHGKTVNAEKIQTEIDALQTKQNESLAEDEFDFSGIDGEMDAWQ